MKEKTIKLNVPNNNFQLMVLGDIHIGDPLCDLQLVKNTIKYIKETPNCYVILNGDMINNALKTSKSDIYTETMSIEDQQDLLIELLEPIKEKILFICSGNHEYRTHLAAGINPLRYVARELGIPKDCFSDYESYLLTIQFGTR
jgi:predicted MPP superfamily phosphohydrolase